MSRLFLTTMTSAGNEANLRAMVEPIAPLFDGVIATFHYPTDEGAEYLESRAGAGCVIYANWCNRHGYSMQHILWQGPMRDGDKFIYLDSMERVSPAFCAGRLKQLVQLMDETDTAMVANYGKGFLFRFNEQLRFEGSPHWYAQGLDGRAINMELDKGEFWNVRDQQRPDQFQFVEHYLKYYLYPAGSNHCLLGLEKNGDPAKLFGPREARRLAFRKEMVRLGYGLNVEAVKTLMLVLDQHPELKPFFRDEKILNDAYRRYILDRTDFKDDHNHSNLVPIP